MLFTLLKNCNNVCISLLLGFVAGLPDVKYESYQLCLNMDIFIFQEFHNWDVTRARGFIQFNHFDGKLKLPESWPLRVVEGWLRRIEKCTFHLSRMSIEWVEMFPFYPLLSRWLTKLSHIVVTSEHGNIISHGHQNRLGLPKPYLAISSFTCLETWQVALVSKYSILLSIWLCLPAKFSFLID